jgi:hypothetical protein
MGILSDGSACVKECMGLYDGVNMGWRCKDITLLSTTVSGIITFGCGLFRRFLV